jgi:hypothetical protein
MAGEQVVVQSGASVPLPRELAQAQHAAKAHRQLTVGGLDEDVPRVTSSGSVRVKFGWTYSSRCADGSRAVRLLFPSRCLRSHQTRIRVSPVRQLPNTTYYIKCTHMAVSRLRYAVHRHVYKQWRLNSSHFVDTLIRPQGAGHVHFMLHSPANDLGLITILIGARLHPPHL